MNTFKRGDTREDGKIYFGIKRGKPCWMSPESFEKDKIRRREAKKRKRKTCPIEKAKRNEAKKRRHHARYGKDPEYTQRMRRLFRENARRHVQKNPIAEKERINAKNRERRLSISFSKQDGSSYENWIESINQPTQTLKAIGFLKPRKNETLSQCIQRLSGYPMETCLAIAGDDEHQYINEPPY